MNKIKSVGIALLVASLVYTNIKVYYLEKEAGETRLMTHMLLSENSQAEFRFHMVMDMWAEEMERVAREVVAEDK